MALEKLTKALYRVRGAIRRFLRLLVPLVGNTIPNGGAQLGADAPPENKRNQKAEIKPTEPPAQKSTVEKPEDPKSLSKQSEKTPQNRGGERDQGKPVKAPAKQRLSPEAKPEFICREVRTRNCWQIFLTLPEDQKAEVSQGESGLSPNNGGEYPLLNFSETLTVKVTENTQNETMELTNGKGLLIFKLRKNWKGDGRKVKYVSTGYYVVFAPCTWQRTGEAPIDPSGSADSEFSAHYFFADGNGDPGGFDECSSFFQRRRFLLKGKVVVDDSDTGDLFVNTPPELTDADNNWHGISWIRVGEEGSGKWSENFKSPEKNLPKVLGNREGWFYVRIYDEDVKMIDGFAFRYLVNLQAILVNENTFSPENIIVPTTDGHTETTIRFDGNIRVKSDNQHITVDGNNTAVIPPNPDNDKTQWILIGENGQVEVGIHLPRIWWRMDNADNEVSTWADDEAGEWRDTAFIMSREAFRSNREAAIIVRLPAVARKIFVGLDSFNRYDGAREYSARHNKNDNTQQAEFKLREFCDLEQIAEYSPRESALRIKCGEVECTLIRIPADAPPPKPKPEQTPMHEPPPGVCNSPQKGFFRPLKNKGFSLSELSESGLTIDQAKHLKITVDHRRKTTHCANIDRLKNIQQGENHAG